MILGASKQEVRLITRAIRYDFRLRYDGEELRHLLYDQQKGRCILCSWAIQGYDSIFCHIEHMISLRLWAEFYATSGRSVDEIVALANDLRNLKLSHLKCGIRKSDRDLDEIPKNFFIGKPNILTAHEIRRAKADQTNHQSFKKAKYKNEIITWYKSGKSTTWIASRLGVCNSAIGRWLKGWKLRMRPSSQFSPKRRKFKNQIIAWYKSGKSSDWIGKRVGGNGKSVRNWLNGWQIKMRSVGYKSPKRKRFKKQIIAWYKSGKSTIWIAKRVGVNCSSIHLWLREWSIKLRPTWAKLASPKKEKYKNQIVIWYENRTSTMWIAKRVGVSAWTICSWLKEWGIKLRPAHSMCSSKKAKYKTQIINWYKNQSVERIAKRLGVGHTTVYSWLKEWNV